jgi:hypothetical protein
MTSESARRVLGGVLTIDSDPSPTQQLGGDFGIAEWDERMERPTWETGLRQRIQSDRLRDRGSVKDYAAARNATVFRRDGDFLDGLIELRIAYAHDDDIRPSRVGRNVSSRCSHARRSFPVHPDDVDS